MQLTKNAPKTQSTQVFGKNNEKITMGINESNIAHITRLLTDLYKNPVAATVREIISNAIDTTNRLPEEDRKPIKVQLPNLFDLSFVVQDFGEGMSKETLAKNYAQYGASTKGTDLSQIGAYGLGAKAPLSYASKFTVESTKDGITTEIFLTSSEDGNKCEFVSSKKTGKPNGTTVTIPVKESDIYRFETESATYKKYTLGTSISFNNGKETVESKNPLYKIGEVEVGEDNGKPVFCDLYFELPNLSREITDEVIIRALMNKVSSIKEYGIGGRFYLLEEVAYLMSGWKYNAPKNNLYSSGQIFVDLKPGVVNFSSSRDEITDDDRFAQLEEKLREQIDLAILNTYNTLIEKNNLTPTDLMFLGLKENEGFSDFNSISINHPEFGKKYDREIDFVQEESKINFTFITQRLVKPSNFNFVLFNDRAVHYSVGTQANLINHLKGQSLTEMNIACLRTRFNPNKIIVVTDTTEDVVATNRMLKKFCYANGLSDFESVIVAYTKVELKNVKEALSKVLNDSIIESELILITEEDFKEKANEFKTPRKQRTINNEASLDVELLGTSKWLSTYRTSTMANYSEAELKQLKADYKNVLFVCNKKRDTTSIATLRFFNENIEFITKQLGIASDDTLFSMSFRTGITSKNANVIKDVFDYVILCPETELTPTLTEQLKPLKVEDLKIHVTPDTKDSFMGLLMSPNSGFCEIGYFIKNKLSNHDDFVDRYTELTSNKIEYLFPEELSEKETEWKDEIHTLEDAVHLEYVNKYTEDIVNKFFDDMVAYYNSLD